MKANVKATSVLITKRLQDHSANIKENLGFIYTCDSLGMNYCMNYSLNNGLYCSKWAYLHFIFGQLLQELKSSMMDCVPIFTGCKQSLGQGNVFTPVCHSVHRGEGLCPTPQMQTPLFRQTCGSWVDPPRQTPWMQNPRMQNPLWADLGVLGRPPGCRPPSVGRPGSADPPL